MDVSVDGDVYVVMDVSIGRGESIAIDVYSYSWAGAVSLSMSAAVVPGIFSRLFSGVSLMTAAHILINL